jgi:hypothetical protein
VSDTVALWIIVGFVAGGALVWAYVLDVAHKLPPSDRERSSGAR